MPLLVAINSSPPLKAKIARVPWAGLALKMTKVVLKFQDSQGTLAEGYLYRYMEFDCKALFGLEDALTTP